MINPVSSNQSKPEPQNTHLAPKPPQPQQTSSAQDKVTLKKGGDKDRDGDSK